MATLREVAAAAGVSICTVSKILNRSPDAQRYAADTVQRVEVAAARLDYRANRAARSLRTRRSGAIGLIGTGQVDPLANKALAAVTQALHARDLQGILLPGRSWEDRLAAARAAWQEGRCDGLLLLAWALSPVQADACTEAGIPIVALLAMQDLPVPAVGSDGPAGARLAAEHLIDGGRRRLAWFGPADPGHSDGAERQAAVAACCAAHDLALDRIPIPMAGTDEGELQAAQAAVAGYLDDGGSADGWVCYHDLIALAALSAARARALRVPADVAIVGYDDVHAAYALPGLSSVSHGFDAAARQAVDLLQAWIDGQPPTPGLRRLPPRLVVRASSAARGA